MYEEEYMEPKSRSELRVSIMNILYQLSIYKMRNISYDIDNVIKENVEIESEFVKDIVYGVITHEEELEKVANTYLNNWTIDRLGFTDQAILKMAIYEFMYTDTPKIVCINEAVELAKKYSDDEVRKMINASLDKLYKKLEDGK